MIAGDAETIEVVVGCDDGYARHLGVMLLSLLAHNPAPLRVHVLTPPGFGSRARLDQAAGERAGCLVYHVLDGSPLPGIPHRADITPATYYRLLMGSILPASVRRVVYLDCDMLVRASLAELWGMPLGEAIAAAVPDPGFKENGVLGLAVDAPYFNAGLLLVDLVRWREADVGAAAIAFALTHPERLTYDDQCALNWVMRGRWLPLDPAWNVQAAAVSRIVAGEVRYHRPLPPVAAAARIVHFNAPGRPWLYMDEHPFKADYLAYQARTAWRDERPPDRYPHNIVLKALRRHARILLPAYRLIRAYV